MSHKIKVWATLVASGEMNLTNYKEWLNAIEPKLKSTRATTGSDVAVVTASAEVVSSILTKVGFVFFLS